METKHESDLTKKEKRQIEIQKLKSMKWKERIDYIWTYYKIWLLGVAIVLLFVNIGISMYHGMRENMLLEVVIVGGGLQDPEKIEDFENEIKDILGSSGKYDRVRVQTNIRADENDPASRMTLTTWIAAGEVDILVCPKEIYREYERLDGFDAGSLILKNKEGISERFGVLYDEIYVCVMSNSKHKQNAEKIMEKFRSGEF